VNAHSWYLSRRITVAFAGTVFALTLVLSAVAAWSVWTSEQSESDSLLREELEESLAFFSDAEGVPDYAEMALEQTGEHPANPMGWRLWRTSDGSMIGEYGDLELLKRAPSLPVTVSLPAGFRWGTVSLNRDLTVGLVLDTRHQLGHFWAFVLGSGVFVLLSTGCAALAGALLGRRVARILHCVALGARTEDVAGAEGSTQDAPEEIRAVVLALRDMLRRIREETEYAQLLTSGMAHELRSPLQNLVGETQVALLRHRTPEDYRAVLESQLEELAALSRVVDNLVTLCAGGEARRRMSKERFDLAEEAGLRLAREFQLAQRRGVTLQLEVFGPLYLDGDRESLLLALRNVVTNAIEWSPAGATVGVRLGEVEEGIEAVVDDAGPGVPESERGRIFQAFQLRPIVPGRRAGFGLGLALTHKAVEAHGGSIAVETSPAGGARFRILLPRSTRDIALARA